MSDWLLPDVAPAKRPTAAIIIPIAVVCAFAATATMATNIFLPSLPAMARTLNVSSAAATSAITVYLAILAIGQLVVGPLSDRFGRRPVNLIGLGVFIVGTIWCAFAGDLPSLLVGRSIQAAGACAASVLSRAVARDLFDGQMLAKVMAMITVATAAALGFSPLLGGMLDYYFGWRSTFILVAVFAMAAASAYAAFVGETNLSARTSMNPRVIARCYLDLIRDARFQAPARTSALLMVGLFAILSGAPRVLLESFILSPITLGWLFAGVVFVVFAGGWLASLLSARHGLARATLVGLGLTATGGVGLLVAVLAAQHSFPLFLGTAAIFLLGLGIASPLASAAALSPFGRRAGIAASLLGFAQMAGAAAGTWLAATVSADPALGLGIVLALASPLALVLAARSSVRRSPALS
jgi:DHA1 family bicyclomycin/chloramphenicol resistance-like MFS transporter